jgi:hypothetical protein
MQAAKDTQNPATGSAAHGSREPVAAKRYRQATAVDSRNWRFAAEAA